MKFSFLAGIAAASIAASSVMAKEAVPATIPAPTAEQAAIIEQVTQEVKSAPQNAAEIVKNAILKSKADALLVAQIMRAAMLQAPDQAKAIYSMVIAVAPDATGMANLMIAAMLSGDEVAQNGSSIKKQLVKFFRNTTDISVDDDNKKLKVLVSRELLQQWVAEGGNLSEVKLDDFTYFLNFGAGNEDFRGYQVIFVQRDSSTIN